MQSGNVMCFNGQIICLHINYIYYNDAKLTIHVEKVFE